MEVGFVFRVLLFACLFLSKSFEAKEYSAKIAPYLMSENHPIKNRLDVLFSSTRATFNMNSLKKAGFQSGKPRKFTRLIVASHPDFPGYIFKLYLDVQRFHKNRPEYEFWALRCEGARKIQETLISNNLQSLFKVPQKWIYLLPQEPSIPVGYFPKRTLIVEEDMDIFSSKDNEKIWASDSVTFEMLAGLYLILKAVGLHDCVKPDNIPFSHDGKIAFVDTQTFDRKVDFKQLSSSLSKRNRQFWKSLGSVPKTLKH